ncbi:MAG: hypothetical protein ACREIQ_03000 [Nitrospiria bacterium]
MVWEFVGLEVGAGGGKPAVVAGGKMNKQIYADRCFRLPVEQVKLYDELTPEQKERAHWFWGGIFTNFVYCIKKNGKLINNRERIRPEWSGAR